MLKMKEILMVLAGVVLFSSASDARVCFLAGSESDASCLSSSIDIESEKCPDREVCEAPRDGSSVCVDAGEKFYWPEDCCSDGTIYEPCNEEGMVCTGAQCYGTSAGGESYLGCERGYCQCDSSYSETCDGEGEIGVGKSCGGKYKSCQCSSNFYACDSAATCGGTTCSDDRGTLCTSCECPAAGDGNWVSDPDKCCGSYTERCTNWPSGTTVYKCNTVSLPECVCGYTRDANKSQCINGCTDSSYEYQGNIPAHVVCNDYISGLTGACGNDCYCDTGYWDFTNNCTAQNDSICKTLGYTDTSCDGDWLACPYDTSAKKCLTEKEITCTDGYSQDITSISNCSADNYGCTYYLEDPNEEKCGMCYQTTACRRNGYYCSLEACEEDSGSSCNKLSLLDFDSNYPGGGMGFFCYAPEEKCPDGYSEDITSTSDCGTYASGWTVTTTTVGSKTCGKCTAKSCPTGSAVLTPFCPNGTIQTVGYSGNSTCKKCMGSSGGIEINPSVSCCNRGYDYDCTNIGKGCSNTQLGTLTEQCLRCSFEAIPSN